MNKPLRVLITSDAERTLDGAIMPHAYATQIEFLRRSRIEVHLFGVDDRTSVLGVLRNISELHQAITRFRPNLIVTYYGSMVSAISRLAAKNIPLLVTFRGSDLLGTSNPGWKWRLRDWLGRRLSLWSASGARQIIVNGNGLLQSLPAHLHHKTHNLPNGINTEIFDSLPKEDARRRLNWSLDEKVILFNAGVGSGQVVKNRPLAEETMARLSPHPQGIRFEVISMCTREEVALRMNASDCLLLTSLHEGSPDLVKEAMACDLPVVSVPCGDVPERLEGVEPGGVRSYDAGQLAELIDSILRSGRRSNGREQLFKQGLDIVSVTEQVLNVYRMAVQ